MDDGLTALHTRAQTSTSESVSAVQPRRRRSMQPHHRRRRAVAVATLVVGLALVVALVAGAGGSPRARAGAPGAGFFARIRQLAGTGNGSFLSAEEQAENKAIDRTLTYTPYVRVAGGQHREIALTFDDGPGPYTPQILSILERENVPATFFEVGVLERFFHASTARIVADGDVIGDHTQSHAPMERLPPAAQRAQLLEQISATGDWGAPFPRLFRPPYGLWDADTLKLLRRYRMLMVLWTVDTSDYRQPGVAAIVHSAVSGARPGAIILMHDGGGYRAQTVEAVPLIIDALRARGYRLVTVPRLLLDNPASADQQISAVVGAGG
jgi:peptidoglycan/xylan/chitin deacetylase (PgdA/CDA1 family)